MHQRLQQRYRKIIIIKKTKIEIKGSDSFVYKIFMIPTGINIKITFTWYELFSAVSLSNDPETISLVIPPYTPGEPLPQLSYITTDIRFRDTIFLDYVNSIIRKINNLITLVNDLIPLIYNTSLESASLSRWGAGKNIR